MTATYETIRQQLSQAVPFVRHLDLDITSVGPGTATVRLPDAPHLLNHVGTQHAGALFSAAETASGAAAVGLLGAAVMTLRPITTDGNIQYRRPAQGVITARAETTSAAQDIMAEVEEHGQATFRVTVTLVDAQDRQVAAASFDWHVSRPR